MKKRFFVLVSLAASVCSTNALAENELNLEGRFTGNREQPKVLTIVPWQRPDRLGIDYEPFSGEGQDTLQPLDREVFLRQLQFYEEGTKQFSQNE